MEVHQAAKTPIEGWESGLVFGLVGSLSVRSIGPEDNCEILGTLYFWSFFYWTQSLPAGSRTAKEVGQRKERSQEDAGILLAQVWGVEARKCQGGKEARLHGPAGRNLSFSLWLKRGFSLDPLESLSLCPEAFAARVPK